MVTMMHTAGTKSYAKRRAAYKAKYGKERDELELFIECHTKSGKIITELNSKKDELPEEEQSLEALDHIFESVVGGGSQNYVKGYGMGVTKTRFMGTACKGPSVQAIELERTIHELKTSMEVQASAHAATMQEQATVHAIAIEEQSTRQSQMQEALEDLKRMIYMMSGQKSPQNEQFQ